MGMVFAPTWLRQVSPLLHKTTLTTVSAHHSMVFYFRCSVYSWWKGIYRVSEFCFKILLVKY